MFQNIFDQFPNLEIDLFASLVNFQLDQYVAWRPDPGCIAVDAFAQNWETKMFYAFPPFSLVPRCLQKITQDQATGILIAPFWPTQTWFPQILQMVCDQPWILAPSATLLQHPVQLTPHPLAKNSSVDGLSCIRNRFEAENLSEDITDIIMSSWRASTKKQYSTYIERWLDFCGQRKIACNSPTLNQALLFLKMLFTERLSYSTINTARSALSTIV